MDRTNKEEMINYVLDYFDFDKVHKVMELLKWEWKSTDGIPMIGDLRQMARDLLREVGRKEEASLSTGGFYVKHNRDTDGNHWFILKFVVSEWDNYE